MGEDLVIFVVGDKIGTPIRVYQFFDIQTSSSKVVDLTNKLNRKER